ncbi:hypothetical protein [Brackiella oedipodis]|uniref:hypothetical protein n=1 Tax=Brackiella oedipodis TaxID=124225 RepID=UPI00048D9F41|nr:hypothetical protein [Brackiella oedipodis]
MNANFCCKSAALLLGLGAVCLLSACAPRGSDKSIDQHSGIQVYGTVDAGYGIQERRSHRSSNAKLPSRSNQSKQTGVYAY